VRHLTSREIDFRLSPVDRLGGQRDALPALPEDVERPRDVRERTDILVYVWPTKVLISNSIPDSGKPRRFTSAAVTRSASSLK
jgi:hypothetical protein